MAALQWARVTAAGYAARSPELRHAVGGREFCFFGVAVTEKIMQDDGERVDGPTTWFTVLCYDSMAVMASKNVQRGTRVIFTGRMRRKDWVDKDGKPKVTLEVAADDLGIASSKEDAERARAVSDKELYGNPARLRRKGGWYPPTPMM